MKTTLQGCRRVALGIVGGAGPLVAARLQWEFLSAYQHLTGAHKDSDFPPVISLNIALEGVDETGVGDVAKARHALREALDILSCAGATSALVACASLHSCLPLRSSITVIDWLGWASRHLAESGYRSIGVVGSLSARKDRVFGEALATEGLKAVELSDAGQRMADCLISQGMTGRFFDGDRTLVDGIRKDLQSRGVQRIWWGCTEFSFLPQSWLGVNDLSSMVAMVSSLLQASLPPGTSFEPGDYP